MAEYDPGHQDAWGENEGFEVDRQDHIQHSTDQDEADYSIDPVPRAPANFPSPDGATDGASAPVSDATLQMAASHHAPQKSQPAAKKPRTAGGFLVADSDSEEESLLDEEEDEDDEESQSSGSPHQPSIAALQDSTSAPSNNAPTIPHPSAAMVAPQERLGNGPTAAPSAPSAPAVPGAASKAPVDKIALLEDRIRDDPRGAMDAWLALINEHRHRSNIEELRLVYERFFAVFPQAADVWSGYLEMEMGFSNFPEAERIFGKCLLGTPNVNLWTKYLDYIRRRNDLNDSSGQARQTVTQAYEFVIDNIGLDKDSGKIWSDYIQFIKFGPGTVGGSQWQDQQKMDQLRRAYQRAICIPMANVNTLWKEYDQFEMGLNKLTGRKYLAEKSPSYMSAKSANTALDNITRGLKRTNLPTLPPIPGFDGDQDYFEQVDIWKRWIAWEKSDPLDLKDDKDQPGLYKRRVLYAYNQALMALRFWPEMWVDAAQWCFDNNVTTSENKTTRDGNTNGLEFLTRGIEANPESVLLAFKHADQIESTYPVEENDEAKIARGEAVRAPYNKVLDTLYGIITALKDRETAQIANIKESMARATPNQSGEDEDDDDEYPGASDKSSDNNKQAEHQIRVIQQSAAAQTQVLSRTITFVWIALIRAMRRIQGKGKPGTALGGMRQAFTDARVRGRLTSDVYAAVAQLEWTIYKEPAGGKIFDRGAKLFPEDENFTLENIKYLHSRDDFTNARVLFETVVNRLTQKPETIHKAKPLYAYFHKYESQFGELAQIAKLEKRMAELFPEDPKLAHFSARYSSDKFDPITTRVVVSPATQLRPKLLMPSIEQPSSIHNSPRPPPFVPRDSPRPQFLPPTDSPKRPLPTDDFEEPPRKIQRQEHQEFQRAVSPLKGAAGRRLDQQRRMQGQGVASYTAAPPPIARDITFLLGQIPRVEAYDYHRMDPAKLIKLLRDTGVPSYADWKASRDEATSTAPRGGPQSHNRQVSGDYPVQYGGYQSRDSPAPQGRPLSPYQGGDGVRARIASASATYRQSSLRPGSSGSYEPPPAVFSQQGITPSQPPYSHMPQPTPQGQQFDGNGWQQQQQYNATPPTMMQQNYGGPQQMGYSQAQLPPQQQAYSRYPY
ncbi:hypothetical protein B0H63DRAFT_395673 [Podospora didyma]|uniref:mRNA 3'-end-processing protein RNA14 n=1 Tax=Podospora didyma TaxID=330526 RepID=A0AAE0NP33_9PEZI|nr:hypothetical protein B0H63DRAFT_395673 [Podospora didyma]